MAINKGYLTCGRTSESDECLTPRYAVTPIIKYLKMKNFKVIWCPFDLDHSMYVRILKKAGFTVINTHLETGEDFFEYEPDNYDCIVSNPPFSCYSDDTEVLTLDGWKLISNVNMEDKVMSVNESTKELKWVNIQNKVKRYTEEDLIHFSNKNMDLLVTKDHRMFAYGRYNNKIKLDKDKDLIRARNILDKTMYMPRSGYKWVGTIENDYITLPYLKNPPKSRVKEYPELKIPLRDWIPFFAIWLADGCTRSYRGTGKGYTVSIKQAEDNWEKLNEVLDKLPFHVCIRYDKEETARKRKASFNINNRQLWEYLKQFGKSQDKFIPQWIKELPTEYLDLFIKWYSFGDSWKSIYKGKETIWFSSVSEQLMCDIQEILLKLGYMSYIRPRKIYTGTLYNIGYNKNSLSLKSVYRKKPDIPYRGYVYCLTLEENSIFLIRRNGKISFSGNCKDLVLERLYKLNKPFMILLPQNSLQSGKRTKLFIQYGLEYLGFDKRICFYTNNNLNEIKFGNHFASGYFCKDVLPEKLIFEELEPVQESYWSA